MTEYLQLSGLSKLAHLRGNRITVQLVVGILAVLICVPVHAQQPVGTVNTDWHFRYELFQMLLEENGLKPASQIDVLSSPQKSVIVKVGNLHGSIQRRELQNFCRGGGRVLLATDRNYTSLGLSDFREGPDGPVEAREFADWYQNERDCIRVTRFTPDHPLMAGVGSLILNRSGWLRKGFMARGRWETIARLPSNCTPQASADQPILASISSDSTGELQMLLAADPSLFTNGMMWHGDNAIFAINVSRILAEGDRTQLLFLVDDRQQSSYADSPLLNVETPLPPLPEAGLDTMLKVANSVIQHVEQSNLLNEALANQPRRMRTPYYRRLLFFALAGLALFFSIWKLAAPRPVQQPNMPVREMQSAHDLESGQKLKSSELGMSASLLARELCEELTGSTDETVWFRSLGNSSVSKSLVRDKGLRKRIAPVVELAVNSRTVHISRSRFASLGRTIIELRELHRHGRLLKPLTSSPSPK